MTTATPTTTMEQFRPLDVQPVIDDLNKALHQAMAKHGLQPLPTDSDTVKDDWAVVYGSMEELVIYACRVFQAKEGLPVEAVNTLDELTERAGK